MCLYGYLYVLRGPYASLYILMVIMVFYLSLCIFIHFNGYNGFLFVSMHFFGSLWVLNRSYGFL